MTQFQESRVSPDAHQLYRSLIDELLADGTVSHREDAGPLLDELAGEDWLALDERGRVSVLYPFSLVPSGIAVRLDGVQRYAMCAIDALGIASMLDREVEVSATCPVTGEQLDLRACGDRVISASPEDIVVVRRRQGGAAHVSRCAATRFFRSAGDAKAWLASDGVEGDVVLSLDDAFDEARVVFGRAYRDGVRMVIPG